MQLILENEVRKKSQASVLQGDMDCCWEGELTVGGSASSSIFCDEGSTSSSIACDAGSSASISCVITGSAGRGDGGGDDGGDDGPGTMAAADLG